MHNASGSGGEVTTIDASPDTTIGEFRSLVLQTLRPDDDELTRKVSVVELILGETPLPEDSDALTLWESGISPEAAVVAIFSKRSVVCRDSDYCSYNLEVPEREVMLKIPDGDTEIGISAFLDCHSVAGVTIPSTVTLICAAAFANCTSLLQVTIPEQVTTIEAQAFVDCRSLTELTLPTSVTEIGDRAFCGCSSLTSLNIPDSVREIGDRAFCGCSSLTSLTLPGSLSEIGANAFRGCASLASLTISGAATHPLLRMLSACSSLADLKRTEFRSLREDIFAGCPLECRVVQG